MNPLVSIIIPTYNRAHLIGETLQSVLEQTYQNWECIVVDDLSTDNTDEVLKSWTERDNRFKYFKRHREPKGAPTCRNIGLDKAGGDYVIFFDSDDIMYPLMLSTFLKEFSINPILGFCCCEADYFDTQYKIVKTTNHKSLDHTIEGHLKHYGFMAPSFMLEKSAVKIIGGWDEQLERLQDVDYFYRLFLFLLEGYWIENSLFKVRIHQENITSKWNRNIARSLLRVHRKILKVYSYSNRLMDNKSVLTAKRDNSELYEILGRRITAFSISALASGFWLIAVNNFFMGWVLLRGKLKRERLKMFLKLVVEKPFKKNEKDIILYN